MTEHNVQTLPRRSEGEWTPTSRRAYQEPFVDPCAGALSSTAAHDGQFTAPGGADAEGHPWDRVLALASA